MLWMTSREFELLLLLARSRPPAAPIRKIIAGGVDWTALTALAELHGVRPLLLRSLKGVCWDAVPEANRTELDRFNRANVQRNLIFTGELFRLLGAFQQAGVPVAAFKGVVLAATVYGDLSMREFTDLDLVVPEMDIGKAEDILAACGYHAVFLDKDYRAAFLSYQGQYMFRLGELGVLVDLHWRLSSKGVNFPLQAAEVWQRLELVAIAGRDVPTFAVDDLALFLAGHGTKEGWRSLAWVCDFAEFLRRHGSDIDWELIIERSRRAHSSRPILLAILLAADLLGAQAPEAILEDARRNPRIRSLAEEVRLRLVRAAPAGEFAEFLAGLQSHDRLRHRLWPIASLLTTRTVGDHRAMPLPKPLWGTYYFTRPFRLAGKAVGMMLSK
jgi:hypothetical protein